MTMETDLRTLLQAGLAPLVPPGSINWAEHPQGVDRPYVVLTLPSDTEGATMQGRDGLRQSRVQVDCYGPTFASVAAIRVAVMDTLHGYRGGNFRGVFFDGARSLREPGDDAVHRLSMDFLTHWRAENA